MTPDEFRRVALTMPGSREHSHMAHPDFRAGGKIFASLFWTEDDEDCGMVKLTPAEQQRCIKAHPDVFSPMNGAWGRQGCTRVSFKAARVAMVRPVIEAAWKGVTTGPAKKTLEKPSKKPPGR